MICPMPSLQGGYPGRCGGKGLRFVVYACVGTSAVCHLSLQSTRTQPIQVTAMMVITACCSSLRHAGVGCQQLAAQGSTADCGG